MKGCVVSQNVKGQLSSEAKPFIPLSAMTYFDCKVTNVIIIEIIPYQIG